MQPGTWYHVAITYDGVALNLYVNGSLDGSLAASGAIVTTTDPMRMGGYGSGPWTLNGRVDEPSLYNRALTQSEIQAIYNASSDGKCQSCSTPPTITTQPLSQTVAPGANVTFTVAATGTAPLSYQWYKNSDSNPVGGNSSTLTLLNVQASDAGNYYVRVSNAAGSATSVTAVLALSGQSVVWIDDRPLPAGNVPMTYNDHWTWSSSNPGPYSGVESHQSDNVAGIHQHYFEDATSTLTINAGDILFCYVYLYSGSLPQEVMLQWEATDGSWWNHRAYWGPDLIAWWPRTPMGALPSQHDQWVRLQVNASDVDLVGRTIKGMAFTLYDGTATWDYAGKDPGTPATPPMITAQPQSQTVVQGNSATFSVIATGTAPLSYQWTFNGANIAGATGSSLTLNNVQPANAGNYAVVVSNSGGSVTSASAVLTVIAPNGPAVSLCGSQPFFTSSPGSLLAKVNVVSPAVLTGLTLNGVAQTLQTGQFTLSPVLSAQGANTFTLVATDNQGRSGQASTTVYLDSVLPTIAITDPANNASFNTTRVNVRGTFSEANLKRITVNGALAFISGNSFEALNVPLALGANAITATAEDLAGNTSSTSITVNGAGTLNDPVQLAATPVGGFAPLQVTFTTAVNVPGTIQQVLYDFNGDNTTFQTATDLSPISHTYTSAGEYFPVVTVQTTAGRFSSAGGWNAGPWEALLRINVQIPPVQVSIINVTDPVDLKWTADGNLYVLSRSTASIFEYNSAGTVVRSLSSIGATPTGLDVDGSGNVYVALSGENHVAKFNQNGGSFQLDTTLSGTGRIGTAGSGDGQFNTPFDVAVTPDGSEIAVSDSGNHRIERFSNTGRFLQSFGQSGSGAQQFNTPKGLTYDEVGNLYVVDSGNNRIVLADSAASLGTSGAYGTVLSQFSAPVNLGVGNRGIYVADTGNNRVQAFDPLESGQSPPFSPRLALASQFTPALNGPYAVSAVTDLLQERLWIADTGNNRVMLVQLPLDDPVAVWNAMKGRLVAGDIAGAIPHIASISAEQNRRTYLTIGATLLAPVIQQIPPITPVFIEHATAQYRFEQTVQGVTLTFPIDFVKENGVWKIMEY